MALTPEEQALLDELDRDESLKMPQQKPIQRAPSAPSRYPGDMEFPKPGLTPEEQELLLALDEEFPEQPAPQENGEGMLSQVGNIIDQYSGAASVRKGVGTLLDTGDIRQSFSDAVDQYSHHPNSAPTGKEIATKMGFDDKPRGYVTNPKTGITRYDDSSDAGTIGFATEMALDPTNLIGLMPITKLAKGGKALKRSAKAAEDAEDAVKFTKIQSTPRIALESTKEAKKSLVKLFKPDLNPDWKDYQRIADENGIPKELLNEAHEFGESSIVSRHKRGVAEGPLGSQLLERNKKFVGAVTGAIDNKVKQIAKSDKILDNAEAGALILEDFDKGVDDFFNGMAETYGNAVKLAPDMTLDKKSGLILNNKLNSMEMWAKKRLGVSRDAENVLNNPAAKKGQINKATGELLEVESSVNKAINKEQMAQAKEVLEAVKLAKRAMSSSGGDLSQVYSAMRDIGDIAFKKSKSLGSIPSDQKKFQELYFGLQKGMTESIRSHLGDDFANALIKNNSDMSDFFSKRSSLEKVLGDGGLASEKVFEKLIVKGDTKQLDALFSIISPEAKSQLKASFLNNVVSRNADGLVNFKTTRNTLDGLRKSGKLEKLFTADELKSLDDVLKLGDGAGNVVLSSSGTGASNAFRDIVGTMRNKIEGDILVDSIANSARKRANFVEIAPGVEAPIKKGIRGLRDSSPVTKRQATELGSKGSRAEASYERNKKIEAMKRLRGIQ